MLSILAQARSYDPSDYKVGDKIKFPMATGRKVEEQTLIYRGKENVKAENGVTLQATSGSPTFLLIYLTIEVNG